MFMPLLGPIGQLLQVSGDFLQGVSTCFRCLFREVSTYRFVSLSLSALFPAGILLCRTEQPQISTYTARPEGTFPLTISISEVGYSKQSSYLHVYDICDIPTAESDAYRSQILTSKVDSRTEKI